VEDVNHFNGGVDSDVSSASPSPRMADLTEAHDAGEAVRTDDDEDDDDVNDDDHEDPHHFDMANEEPEPGS
jgi:hypothetical protein